MVELVKAVRRIIYDKPARDDAFIGGGHSRTAKALAKLIRTFDAETRAIGLEGRWGSGKSSVVEMATKLLEEGCARDQKEERRYHIFTYDLWAHQTAGFRRTFLEQLIAWLRMEPGADDARLSEIHDQITNRTIKTTTTNTKRFSPYGLAVLLFLLALPLIYTWLSPFAFTNKAASAQGFATYAKVIVGVMALLTIGQVFSIWWRKREYGSLRKLVGRWWRKEPLSKAKAPPSLLEAASSALSPFSKDAEITNIEQRIREVDPSQHEFEETFKDILAAFQTIERRVIIVFDNIDRLPSDKIKDAWSDVRAMVSSERPSDTLERKVTIIIPYDREHILNAVKMEGENAQVQEDLLRKSFDAVLYVAPPVIADTSSFFERTFRDALGEHLNQEDSYRVYKIFDLSCQGDHPTPRKIIAYINSVAGLWEEWEGRMPLPTIAVFMTHREKISRDPGCLRRPDELDARQRDLAGDDDLFKNLAALAYNVEPDYAFQILLHGPMEELFTSEKPEAELNEITKSPAWDTILPDIYRANAGDWAHRSGVSFRNAVRNLSILDATPSQKLESKRALINAVSNLSHVDSASWKDFGGLVRLFAICDQKEATKWASQLGDWLSRALPAASSRTTSHGRHWIAFIGEMLEGLEAAYGRDDAIKILGSLTFPEGTDFLIGVAYDTDQTTLHLRELPNVIAKEDLGDALSDRLTDIPGEFYYAWPEIAHLVPETTAGEFAEKLAEHLRGTLVDQVADSSFMVRSYNSLIAQAATTETLTKARRALTTSGSLYYHIELHRGAGPGKREKDLAALLWTLIDQTKGKLPSMPDFSGHTLGNLNAGRDWVYEAINDGEAPNGVVGHLAGYVEEYHKLTEWIEWAIETDAVILRQVINHIVGKQDFEAPPVATVAKHYAAIKPLLGDNLEKFLTHLGTNRPEAEWSSIDPTKLPLAFVAVHTLRSDGGWRLMYEAIDTWLKNQDGEAIKQALVAETHLLHMLQLRVRESGLNLPPERLKFAIRDHALSIFSGDHQSGLNFDAVWNALPSSSQIGLSRDILDHLERMAVTPTGIEGGLRSYPELIAKLPLAKRPDVAARKVILQLVEASMAGSEAAMAFLETHKRSIRSAIKKIEDESILGEFYDILGSSGRNEDKIGTDLRARILDLIGLKKAAESKKENRSKELEDAAE